MTPWDDDTIVIGGASDDEDISFTGKLERDPGEQYKPVKLPPQKEPEPEPEKIEDTSITDEIEAVIEIGGVSEDQPAPSLQPAEEEEIPTSEYEADSDEAIEESSDDNIEEPAEDTEKAEQSEVEEKPEDKAPEKEKEPTDKPDDKKDIKETDKSEKKEPEPAAMTKREEIAAPISLKDAAEAESGMDFEKNLLVSASPHLHYGETTKIIMQDVIIALIPAAVISVVYFGLRALLLIALCVGTSVLSEFICRKVMKRRQTIGDYSAVVTGLLLAFSLPPMLNPVYAVIGSAIAIVVVKQMFGGIGMNFANPAVTARIVLFLSFAADMCAFSRPFYWMNSGIESIDAVSGATPLAESSMPTSLLELFVGYHAGCLGETCAIALILGGCFLLLRRIITWEIPVCFIGTVFVLSWIFGQDPLYAILSGGVMLGAIFMATDYTTSPVNKTGKIVFGIGCGLLTVIIRRFTNMPEGVSFAILLMNILVPHIERLTSPKPFGEERKAA